MRKFVKRFLAVVLCVAMCFASVAVSVFAAPVVVPLLKFAASWVVEQIGDELMNTAWNNLQPETVLENKNKFIALLRKFAIENNMDYDTAHQWLADCCGEWDISFIDKYGDNASEMYNIMHEPVYQLCNNYIYQCDLSTLATLVTQTDEAAPSITDDGKVQVPVPALKDHIQTTNNWYFPKNTTNRISYRTESFYKTKSGQGLNGDLTLYTLDNGFCNAGAGYEREVWLCPFYTDGTNTYYGKEQLHIYIELGTDDDGNRCTFLKRELYNMYDDPSNPQQVPLTYTYFTKLYSPNFLLIELDFGLCYINSYTSRSDFLNRINGTVSSAAIRFSDDYVSLLNSGEKSISMLNRVYHFFWNTWSDHDSSCSHGSLDDVGYIFSNEMINFNYAVDTTKIPDNYYVTISNDSSTGDTIYNYTLVNPDTGQKDTIQNFITNNYTFTTTNEGDTNISGGNGSGGSLSGDITVDGKVDIGGKVDINVNVNGGNSGDINFPDTDLIENLPEVPQGFIDYLKKLFDFLPAPVLAILIGVIAAAGICRIWGR